MGLAAAGASFLPVVLLLAERMRNAGKFTMADVLAFRLRERPARIAAALGTLVVSFVYLIAQMVGAGVLLQALAGLDFAIAVTITGVFMLVYVIFGGMLATTWVQIIKAGLLMIAGTVLTILVLSKAGFNPFELFRRASDNYAGRRQVPRLGPAAPERDQRDLLRARAAARHRRAAASAHALLHRARREGGPRARSPGASCSSGCSSR